MSATDRGGSPLYIWAAPPGYSQPRCVRHLTIITTTPREEWTKLICSVLCGYVMDDADSPSRYTTPTSNDSGVDLWQVKEYVGIDEIDMLALTR